MRTPQTAASRAVTSDRRASEPLTANPRFASNSAMPLIPIPPMPTKWIRRVWPRNIDDSSRSRLHHLQHPVDDHARGIRTREPARGGAHATTRVHAGSKGHDRCDQAFAREITLFEHLGRPLAHHGFGVLALVVEIGR